MWREHLHRKWRHQSNNLLRVTWTRSPRNEIWVKIRREILVEDWNEDFSILLVAQIGHYSPLRSDMLAVRGRGALESRESHLQSFSSHIRRNRTEHLSTPENITIIMQFWKPGTAGPGSLLDRASETEDVVLSSAPISTGLSLQAQRQQLPIFKHSNVLNYTQHACTDTQDNRGQAVACD